jgi:hypothetical protein
MNFDLVNKIDEQIAGFQTAIACAKPFIEDESLDDIKKTVDVLNNARTEILKSIIRIDRFEMAVKLISCLASKEVLSASGRPSFFVPTDCMEFAIKSLE